MSHLIVSDEEFFKFHIFPPIWYTRISSNPKVRFQLAWLIRVLFSKYYFLYCQSRAQVTMSILFRVFCLEFIFCKVFSLDRIKTSTQDTSIGLKLIPITIVWNHKCMFSMPNLHCNYPYQFVTCFRLWPRSPSQFIFEGVLLTSGSVFRLCAHMRPLINNSLAHLLVSQCASCSNYIRFWPMGIAVLLILANKIMYA